MHKLLFDHVRDFDNGQAYCEILLILNTMH